MIGIKSDILIIGGGPAASVMAGVAKSNYPDKKIVLIKEFTENLVPCGIPYVFGNTLGDSKKDIAPYIETNDEIQSVIGKVNRVDIAAKKAFSDEYEIAFDKLVFATGSIPFVHENLRDSLNLKNVFAIYKDKKNVDLLKNYLEGKKRVIIIGSGFIGVEIADELAGIGKEVIIISGSKHILENSFDKELAKEAEHVLLKKGVLLKQGNYAKQIIQNNSLATCVELFNGERIEGEVFIFATGYQPNTTLAKDAGLKLARYGGIWVDEYMRTRNKDIFAIGDCCGRRDFITRDPSKVMLASTSASEARVAGSSLYKIKYMKGFNGTIAIFSTMIGDSVFASAGITEAQAITEKIDYISATFTGVNRHPSTIPDAKKQSVKLVAMKHSGQIIGGQVIGAREAGEIINIIGLAIESELTIYSIISLQMATQPLLTAAPTTYPIVKAAEMIAKKLDN